MQILDTGMDNNMTICGLLKSTVLSFCKENYEYPDIDIDGIICVSFKNSCQQHVVHIHDKVIKGGEKDVNASVIGQNGDVLKDTTNDLVFKKSENCCYACVKERGDNPYIEHKNFNNKHSKEISNFTNVTTKKGPPPLYNSKTLCFTDNPRSFENDIHVSRFKNNKFHQNRRKSQSKIHQPLKNISSNQSENYRSSEMCHPVGSVLEGNYQQGIYREAMSQARKEEAGTANQMVDNKISRAICIENDEISQRDKVVVKLELMDSENEEDFRVMINEEESDQVSDVSFSEGEKYTDEMDEFCKDKDIQENPVRDDTQNKNFEERDGENSQAYQDENSKVNQDENSKPYLHDNSEEYQDGEVKFDIDNLAHHINLQSEGLQSELVSTDSVLKDIKCITTDDDCMQIVNTVANEPNYFTSNHGNWDSYNNLAENAMLDEPNSMNMNSDSLTSRPDCPGSSHQSVKDQNVPASGRSFIFQNLPQSGYRVNFSNKLCSKRFLPLQRLKQFGNMKTSMGSSILMPFRKGCSRGDQFAKEKKYHCKHCGMGFTTTGNKTRHERTTCGQTIYKCDFCQACFSRSDSKARHMLVRHGMSVTG